MEHGDFESQNASGTFVGVRIEFEMTNGKLVLFRARGDVHFAKFKMKLNPLEYVDAPGEVPYIRIVGEVGIIFKESAGYGAWANIEVFKMDITGTITEFKADLKVDVNPCLLYTSPSPRDQRGSRMPSSA